MWCPRCNQGYVRKVRIRETGEVVHICEECDALWSAGKEVSASNFVDFSQYVQPLGLKGVWREVEVVE